MIAGCGKSYSIARSFSVFPVHHACGFWNFIRAVTALAAIQRVIFTNKIQVGSVALAL